MKIFVNSPFLPTLASLEIFLQDLEESCAELNEESTARLAYSFLTCHLQQHKRKIHICEDDASIERYVLHIYTHI